jgi:hypothetical protein
MHEATRSCALCQRVMLATAGTSGAGVLTGREQLTLQSQCKGRQLSQRPSCSEKSAGSLRRWHRSRLCARVSLDLLLAYSARAAALALRVYRLGEQRC